MADAVRERWLGEAAAEAVALDPAAGADEPPVELPLSPNRSRAPPSVNEPKVKDDYERDTDAPEEIDLMGLLLPDGKLPHCLDRFSLQYSMAAFKGWVKQRSPACAAASVAGSWNALMGTSRGAEGALGQDDVVAVFAHNLEESIAKKRAKLERLLGAPIDAVDAALREKIGASGKSLGGKKEEKLTKKHLVRLLKEVVAEAAAAATAASSAAAAASPAEEGAVVAAEGVPPVAEAPPTADEGGAPSGGEEADSSCSCIEQATFMTLMDPAMALFYEIFQKEGPEEPEEPDEGDEEDDEEGGGPPVEGDNDEEDDTADVPPVVEPEPEPVDEDAAALAELQALNGGGGGSGGGGDKPWKKGGKKKAGSKKKGGGGKKKKDGEWKWRADVTGLYSVVGGLEKLRRDKPSTGFFVRVLPHLSVFVLAWLSLD